ncbi:MAG: ImmA/IrrE family metallo-endopeptidase [Anaerolineales bacterium]|nr:ImmA/IrrE family metallo-endopeptidase [Anaerolineales bacterium]
MQIRSSVDFLPDSVIENRAQALLDRYRREIGPVDCFPVPAEKIADLLLELQIDWAPIDDTDVEPVLAAIIPSTHTLRLNERRRPFFNEYFGSLAYSIAHELGHHELHLAEPEMVQLPLLDGAGCPAYLCRHTGQERDRRELQAERFAASLLMPTDLLLPVIKPLDLLKWRTLYELRDNVGVSISALVKRLEGLGRLFVTRDRKLYRSREEATGQATLF